MNVLVELINKKITELRNYKIDTETADFLKRFNSSVSSLCRFDFIDLVTCFYIVKCKKSLEEVLVEINKIYPFLEDMIDLDYEEVLILTDMFYELKSKYADKLGGYKFDDYMSLRSKDEEIVDVKELLRQYQSMLSITEINNFLAWMNDDDLSDLICLASCLKGIEANLEKAADTVNDLDIPEFLSSKITRKLSDDYVKDVTGSYLKSMNTELEEDIEELTLYRNKYINEVNSLKKKINKEIRNLESLLDEVNKGKLNIDLLKLTSDDEIKYHILVELIKLKNVKYKMNYQKLKEYQENPVNKLEKLFHEYGYNFNLLSEKEQNKLMFLDDEEKLEENIRFLSSSSLKFLREDDFAFIDLLLLDIENLMQLDSLIVRNKISQNFILKYGNQLNPLSIKLLVKNISKLDGQKVNFDSLLEYNDNLLLDLNLKLFDTISEYGIDFKSPNLKQYEFLENPKLLSIIDSFIEIGLLNQIKNLPNLINIQSLNVIKRIILMKQIGVGYINDKNTINQMARSGKDFFISDDDLNDYTYENYVTFMDDEMFCLLNDADNVEIIDEIPDEIKFIESYKKNNQVYVIGSNFYSRIKVLRCLKTLIDAGYTDYKDMLFNSLIYNYPNYLSFETIEELKNIDKNIVRKQLK